MLQVFFHFVGCNSQSEDLANFMTRYIDEMTEFFLGNYLYTFYALKVSLESNIFFRVAAWQRWETMFSGFFSCFSVLRPFCHFHGWYGPICVIASVFAQRGSVFTLLNKWQWQSKKVDDRWKTSNGCRKSYLLDAFSSFPQHLMTNHIGLFLQEKMSRLLTFVCRIH